MSTPDYVPRVRDRSVSSALVAEGHEAITERRRTRFYGLMSRSKFVPFERRYSGIRFLSYCGVIQVGQLTIEILPKSRTMTIQERRARLDRELLLRMLAVARDLPLFDTSVADIELQKHHLLDLVVAHFCNETYRQFHKGLIRRYIAKEEVLRLIRGRWLVGADINHNVGRKDLAHCEFDEFTDDNAYNQAIKATLRLLISITAPNRRLGQSLRNLDAMLTGVTDRQFDAAAVRDLPQKSISRSFRNDPSILRVVLVCPKPKCPRGRRKGIWIAL